MLYAVRADTWFGGVYCPTQQTPHGLSRPEVGAWLSETGDLLAMIAESPGRGLLALEQALQVALRRHHVPRPARLAVQDDRLRERLRRHTNLPLEPWAHGRFDSVVGAELERIAGRQARSPHAEGAVSHALARALFLGAALPSKNRRLEPAPARRLHGSDEQRGPHPDGPRPRVAGMRR